MAQMEAVVYYEAAVVAYYRKNELKIFISLKWLLN